MSDHHPDSSPGHGRVSTASAPGTDRVLKRAAVASAGVLLIAFVVAFIVRQHHESVARRQAAESVSTRPLVEVVTVEPAAKHYPLQLPGQTSGFYQSTIYSRVDGYVASWSADIGDRVKQGQALAQIDTPEMDQQLNAARAKAAASAAQAAVAQSGVSIAKLTYDRWRDSPKGVVSEQEREEKKAAYEEAQARLLAAQAQTRLDEAEMGRYAAMEKFKTVTAPYDGIITARRLDVGDLVSAGSSANTNSLYGIAQSNVMRVFVDVPQKAAADLAAGLGAAVTSNQFPGRSFQGKLVRTAMSMDPKTRTQLTEVDVPNPNLALVPGMYVEVTFQLNQRGLLQVPAAALMYQTSGLQVAVVDPSGRITFRAVSVAKDNGDTVVLEGGVASGEKVALNLSSAVTNGQRVTVHEEKR